MSELVKYQVDGGVAIITLCDPPANTYTYEMMQQQDTCILKERMDESAHVSCTPTRRSVAWSRRPSWSSPRSTVTPWAAVWKSPWRQTCASPRKRAARSACPK